MAGAPDASPRATLASDLIFAASTQPILIIDSISEKIVEANPAAALLLGVERDVLMGMQFLSAFDVGSVQALRRSLAVARTAMGVAELVAVRALCAGMRMALKLSSFVADRRTYLLAHLTSQAPNSPAGCRQNASSAVLQAIDAAPVGFLVTDSGFVVEYVNRTFMEMVDLGSAAEICGRPLARWLRLSAMDLERLQEQRSHRQASTQFCAALQVLPTQLCRVDVCAVAVPDGPDASWGFTVREAVRLH